MQTIGLIAAMRLESTALLRLVKRWQRINVGSFHGDQFVINGHACILVTSGMGSRRAGMAASAMTDQWVLSTLISFGVAGAVDTDLEIGDVVMGEYYRRLNHGILSPMEALESWPEPARQAVFQALATRGAQLYVGTAVTTSGSQKMEYMLGEMRHPVLEMETAGIASIACKVGIPLLSLRAISDGPKAPLPFDLNQAMDDDANLHIGRMLMLMLRNPGKLSGYNQLMRNTRLAADNAAVALLAGLENLRLEEVNIADAEHPD